MRFWHSNHLSGQMVVLFLSLVLGICRGAWARDNDGDGSDSGDALVGLGESDVGSDEVEEARESTLRWGIGREALLSFEEVTRNLSEIMEKSFDVYILINTAPNLDLDSEGRMMGRYFSGQHALVLSKSPIALSPSWPSVSIPASSHHSSVFIRGAQGKIMGFAPESILPVEDPSLPLMKISSGVRKDGGILTFSGIFRIDPERQFSADPEAPMSFAMYIRHNYSRGGRASGVALHGTPTKFHHLLGVYRASHGCLRTFPRSAERLREWLFQRDHFDEDLPSWNPLFRFPSLDVRWGVPLERKAGPRALMIIFNGYSEEVKLPEPESHELSFYPPQQPVDQRH